MLIEYTIKYHHDGVTISQRIEAGSAGPGDEIDDPLTGAQLSANFQKTRSVEKTQDGEKPVGGAGPSDRGNVGGGGFDDSPVVILGAVIVRGQVSSASLIPREEFRRKV